MLIIKLVGVEDEFAALVEDMSKGHPVTVVREFGLPMVIVHPSTMEAEPLQTALGALHRAYMDALDAYDALC